MEELPIDKIGKSENEDERVALINYYLFLPKHIKVNAKELKPTQKIKSDDNCLFEINQVMNRGVTVVSGKLNLPSFVMLQTTSVNPI